MVDGTGFQPGANCVGRWYARNLRSFANIVCVVTRPDDEVFVIYGWGHPYLLRQFARESGPFRVIDIADDVKDR